MRLFDNRFARVAGYVLLCAPGLYQVTLLLFAIFSRFSYPYDLEWMEGGMLVHAQRIADGQPIYQPPSLDFIPYLYTPGYPALVAGLGSIFGISYQLGRAISVLSVFATLALVVLAIRRERMGEPAKWATASVVGMGIIAATYPWVKGWYDLVRGDTFFLAMAICGLFALRIAASRTAARWRGFLHVPVALCAALLAASFFFKQTGVLFVAAGGAALLVANWRAVPIYTVVAGLVGLGGTAIGNRITDGWFWTYIFEYHQHHDTNIDRFWMSFGFIFKKFPVMTALLGLAIIAVVAQTIARRRWPRRAGGFLYWLWMYICGVLIGCLGFSTQWAEFNAFVPAMTLGAIATGLAVITIADAVADWVGSEETASRVRVAAQCVLLACLGAQFVYADWTPSQFVPTRADRAAGDRLIARLRATEGEIFVPSHPWYARLAGKPTYVHRMSVMDVTHLQAGSKLLRPRARTVEGLAAAIREHKFALVVLDNRHQPSELTALTHHYRLDERLEPNERPAVYTGARTVPYTLWVPNDRSSLPPGARTLFDFESGTFDRWEVTGTAWGKGPVSRSLPKQAMVGGFGGRQFANSFHGTDKSIGTLTSPRFTIGSKEIWLRIGGGSDPAKLRVELRREDGTVVRSATGPQSEVMARTKWDLSDEAGQIMRLHLVDESTEAWGHITVDEIWTVSARD